jgi:transketolase
MLNDSRIFCVTADLGFRYWNQIASNFPSRLCTVGAAEQLAVGVGVGLALEGKIPLVYSITPFILYRPAEWLRNYLNHENIPVKLVGSGYMDDYKHDGYTHFCDIDLLECFPNIEAFVPNDAATLEYCLQEFLYNDKPSLLVLRR